MKYAIKMSQTIVAQVLLFINALLIVPLIIKLAGVEEYGYYIIIITWLNFLLGVSNLGVGISGKRRLPSTTNNDEISEIYYKQFWYTLSTLIITSIVACIFYEIYTQITAKVENNEKIEDVSSINIVVYIIVFGIFGHIADYFRYTHRIKIFNIITVGVVYYSIINLLLIYMDSKELKVSTIILTNIYSTLIITLYLLYYVKKELGFKLVLYKYEEFIKELKIGIPLVIVYIVEIVNSVGDRIIIGIMMEVKDVGAYVPAYILGSLPFALIRVYGIILPPLLAKLNDQKNYQKAQEIINKTTRIYLIISIPFVFGTIALGKEVLTYYTNSEIASKTWITVVLISIGMIFNGLMQINSNLLFVKMKLEKIMMVNIMCATINIVLNITLIAIFHDVNVAAIVTLITYAAGYILISNINNRQDKIKINQEKSFIIKLIACSIIMILINYQIEKHMGSEDLMNLIFKILLCIVIYSIGVLIMYKKFKLEI